MAFKRELTLPSFTIKYINISHLTKPLPEKIVRPSLWVTSGLPHLKIIVAQTSQGAAYVLSN